MNSYNDKSGTVRYHLLLAPTRAKHLFITDLVQIFSSASHLINSAPVSYREILREKFSTKLLKNPPKFYYKKLIKNDETKKHE